MSPDPKLIEAMEEIKTILRKHDIAAVVLLSSPDAMEFRYELSPSWSCATLSDAGELRIRSKLVDYPSKEAQKKHVEVTTGIFLGFIDVLRHAQLDMENVAQMLGRQFDISHWSRRL